MKIIFVLIHIFMIPLIFFAPRSFAQVRSQQKPININVIIGKTFQERYTRQQMRSILLLYLSQQSDCIQFVSKEETFSTLKARQSSLYIFDYVRSAQNWEEVCWRVKKSLDWTNGLLLQPDNKSQKKSLDLIQKVFLALTVHPSSNSPRNKNLRILIGYTYLVPSLRTGLQISPSSIPREVIRAAEIYTLLCRQQKKFYSHYAIEMYNLLLRVSSLTPDEKAKFAYFLAYIYLNTNQHQQAVHSSKLIPNIEGMREAPSRIKKQALKQHHASSRK